MNPRYGPLTLLPRAKALFRVSPARPVSAHAAHRAQKQMKFRLPFSKETFAEMGDGAAEGINSVY